MRKVSDTKDQTGAAKFHYLSRRRLLWLLIIPAVMAFYFLVNRFAHGGVQLLLPVDKLIPLYPPAVVPYLLASVLFIGFPVWAAVYAKPGEFEAYTISVLAATVLSYIIYLVFPTFVTRPEITSTDVFSKAISLLYQTDRAYNAAPSGHTFYTVLLALYLGRWSPGYKLIWAAVVLIVLASTLFTRQHYILDLVSGLALAVLAYILGRFVQKKWNLRFAS